MAHEIVIFENGTASLKDVALNEAMHSKIGPHEEAQTIYVGQSRLAERLSGPNSGPLVVYDLGLGIATNALCAMRAAAGATRELQIISFENQISGLRMAFETPDAFPLLQEYAPAVESLLKCGEWNEGKLSWRLIEGDYLKIDLSRLPPPELIYFDFYSPKSSGPLWGIEAFAKIRERAGTGKCELLTYCSTKAVRVAMLAAGFFVGEGTSTAEKKLTTVAATSLSALKKPLAREWLTQLDQSTKRLPFGISLSEEAELLEKIRLHPQFSG